MSAPTAAPARLDPDVGSPLLVPGRNCWRIEHAQRVAFLIDGSEYFGSLRESLRRAQHSILILGWDIDSRMALLPRAPDDDLPETLGDFLNAVVSRRGGPRARVLSWDYAMLFALEREWLSTLRLDWRTHRRLEFRLDNRHPLGASQHQKVVVIDDAVAFVGGFDLTRCRWDTSAHAPTDPRRRDPEGKSYGPFHDVQMVVQGDAALALGELARARWYRATGRRVQLAPPLDRDAAPWPPQLQPALTDVAVAVARTEPAFEQHRRCLEIRRLYQDSIGAARRAIFLENQYFSSTAITAALARRLGEADGPELVLITPQRESGWLEQSTMGVLRARLQRKLSAADVHGRFRPYCPVLSADGKTCLNVHSKVMIVDDELLTIGSANLSNRSMGLDTECNLALSTHGQGSRTEAVRAAIAALRARLLGEHLDVAPARVEAETRRRGLIGAIEHLRGGARTLAPAEPEMATDLEALVPDQALIDPERPLDPDRFIATVVPPEQRGPALGRAAVLALVVFVLGALAVAWRFTPLQQLLDVGTIVQFGERLRAYPLTPLLVIAGYVVAGLLVMPVVLLIAVTGMVFGPWLGTLYAIAGAAASAATTYGIGRGIGRDLVRRFSGKRINRLNRLLARRGLWAVAVLRLLPVAPFSVINVVAGASQVGLRDFLLGTIVGMTPGIVLTVLFVDRITAALHRPDLASIALLAGVVSVIVAAAWLLHRRFGQQRNAS